MSQARKCLMNGVRGASFLGIVAALLLFQGAASGQLVNLNSVTPEAAAPGDVVTFRGNGFLSATHVRFTANVGGFAGQFPNNVPVTPTSDTELKVVVPLFNNFQFPPAVPPGNPLGFADIRDVGGLFSTPVGFYYLEGDHDGVTTVGLGSTNTSGCRGSAGFTIPGGPPVSGNAGFVLSGDNLTAFATSFTVVGFPPFGQLPVLDGLLAFEPLLPFGVPASTFSDATGRAFLPAPIGPVMIGSTFTLSWVYVDSVSFVVHITNGLQFTL